MKSRRMLIEMSIATFVIFILLWIMVPKFITSQNINRPLYFPDPAFRYAAEKALGVAEGEPFTRKDASNYKGSFVLNGVNNLKGLEYFSNVEFVRIINRNATGYHLTHMPNLKRLDIISWELIKLDISKNSTLQELHLSLGSHFKLRSTTFELVLPDENNIEELYIADYDQPEFDTSPFPKLRTFNIYNRSLGVKPSLIKSIDVSNNPHLRVLNVRGNVLTELDLSNNPLLTRLDCVNNQITSITFATNTALEQIEAGGNQLKELDLSHSERLYWIELYSNPIHTIKLPHNRQLKEIRVSDKWLTDETITHFKEVGVRVIQYQANP